MNRFLTWCFCFSPVFLTGLIIWAYVNIGLAIIFMALSCFGSGYVARWIDEGIAREDRIRRWTGPV